MFVPSLLTLLKRRCFISKSNLTLEMGSVPLAGWCR